jgi:hypothetical protein
LQNKRKTCIIEEAYFSGFYLPPLAMKFSTFLSCSFLGSLWIINGIFVVEAQENFATVAPGDCALVREEY